MKKALIIFILFHVLIYLNRSFSGFIFDLYYTGIFSTIFLYSYVNLALTLLFLAFTFKIFKTANASDKKILAVLLTYLILITFLFIYILT